jgi:N-acetyl-anhydromuramyl-L-alanine amidase AmpD
MVPETWDDLLSSWTRQVGPGDCAHFVIGRESTDGVVQLVPITHNANHAGGPGHGSFVAGAQSWHPNSVSVGIEVHCAGAVRKVDGDWRLVEDGRPQGAAISDDDVEPDPQRPGRGWHKVTGYQYQQLASLLDALETVLGALPQGCVAQSVEQPPAYASFTTGRTVGHVSLHAAQRGDPWPPTCDWMRSRT